jgi:pyruvate kinase
MEPTIRGNYRHTKIIATLGPVTESPEKLREIIRSGVDVVRLNMAHATTVWVADIIRRIREASWDMGRSVAVMMDVKGPEIRTGRVETPIELTEGQTFEFYTETPTPGMEGVDVNYHGLPGDVEIGTTILVDSGLIRLKVEEKDATHVRCKVLIAGTLGSRRHINLPGVQVKLPPLTKKDETDLATGVEHGIDFVALSFVREAEDVQILRKYLDSLGSKARIISKIEDQAGVRNLAEIVRVSDAIMVARGDLGIEIDYHMLPVVQTRIVDECHREGKPVIIATHLLESMVNSPMPTRAEISDVSNGVREMADAIMLSGETTTGRYPLECVEVLKNIIRSNEPTVKQKINRDIELKTPKAKMLRSACALAQELGDSGIVVFTRSGFLGYVLGALRPLGVPIFAFTDVEVVFRQLLLPWGVEPFLIEFDDDPEVTIKRAFDYLKRQHWPISGKWLVVITNALAHEEIIDTLQLRSPE